MRQHHGTEADEGKPQSAPDLDPPVAAGHEPMFDDLVFDAADAGARDDGGLADLAAIAADYAVVEQIGRGSSGVVWRARDLALERDVAIKVVRAAPGDDEVLERSAQEARLVARLPHHPNIVAIHAVRRLGPRSLALVMQFVSGGTLRDRLVRDGALAPADATAVLRDLARALHFAHGAGVVHRDVKPENVYLDAATGRALLSDFGAATLLHADARRTAVGAVIGTPAYMSPEQLTGSAVDGRSDLYSVGLVGWEMLTGRFPWGSSNLYEILYRQRHTELAPVDTLRPDLPAPIVSAVEGALERDPARRWPSAATFLSALLAPADAPRHVRHVTGALAPSDLASGDVEGQHARTVQLPNSDGDSAIIAPVERHDRDPEVWSGDTTVAALTPSADVGETDALAAHADQARDDGSEYASDDASDDAWRPDARDPVWRAALAAMPASPRRRPGRRLLAALVGTAGAASLVLALALRDEAGGVDEVAAREVATREVAGDLADPVPVSGIDDPALQTSDERALARDLAATEGALDSADGPSRSDAIVGGDAGDAGEAGDAMAVRCASGALADQRACLLARLAVHDAPLNATYVALVRALRVRDGGRADGPDTPSVRRLRERQRAWVMGRDRACRDAGVARAGVRWAEERARCLGTAGDRWTAMLSRELAATRRG